MVTFDRHPATVVRPDSAPTTLTDLEQKLELLADCGVDRTLLIPFDQKRSEESAEDFVIQVLSRALAARLVVVGRDFHFGHGRKGNVALLSEMGQTQGFDVEPVELFTGNAAGRPRSPPPGFVGSSRRAMWVPRRSCSAVRTRCGARSATARAAGARLLGFPTANVGVAHGDRAARPRGLRRPVLLAEHTGHPAAISVGQPPTFASDGDSSPLVEAYLIDFDGDLYGQPAKVSFEAWIRPQRAFDDLSVLTAQMGEDVGEARRMLT